MQTVLQAGELLHDRRPWVLGPPRCLCSCLVSPVYQGGHWWLQGFYWECYLMCCSTCWALQGTCWPTACPRLALCPRELGPESPVPDTGVGLGGVGVCKHMSLLAALGGSVFARMGVGVGVGVRPCRAAARRADKGRAPRHVAQKHLSLALHICALLSSQDLSAPESGGSRGAGGSSSCFVLRNQAPGRSREDAEAPGGG